MLVDEDDEKPLLIQNCDDQRDSAGEDSVDSFTTGNYDYFELQDMSTKVNNNDMKGHSKFKGKNKIKATDRHYSEEDMAFTNDVVLEIDV